VTIAGPGSALATVSGNDSNRVFEVNSAGTISVAVSGLTLTHGKTGGRGGAVYSLAENLTLTDCTISSSVAGVGGGASISGGSGNLTFVRCTVTGNHSSSNGGGIDTDGGTVISLQDTAVVGNKAAGQGGGLGVGSSSLV